MNNTILNQLNNSNYEDDLLYHYTTTTTAIEGILESNYLRFHKLTHSNDPLEFYDYNHNIMGDSGNELIQATETLDDLGKYINSIIKKGFRFASFSSDSKIAYNNMGKGYLRSRMWSQYADKHTGVCIVLSKSILLSNANDKVLELDVNKCIVYSGHIKYDNNLRALQDALILDVNDKAISPIERIKRNKEAYLFTKLEDYQDENEFRIVIYHEGLMDTNEDYESIIIGNAIKAIIVGCKYCNAYSINMLDISQKRNIPIYKLYWNSGIPSLMQLTRMPH